MNPKALRASLACWAILLAIGLAAYVWGVSAAQPEYNAATATTEILSLLRWDFDEGTGELNTLTLNQMDPWINSIYDNHSFLWVLDGNEVKTDYSLLNSGQKGTLFLKWLRWAVIQERKSDQIPIDVDSARATAESDVDTEAALFKEF